MICEIGALVRVVGAKQMVISISEADLLGGMWGQRISTVGGRKCQEYSVASLNIKNLMSPTPRN